MSLCKKRNHVYKKFLQDISIRNLRSSGADEVVPKRWTCIAYSCGGWENSASGHQRNLKALVSDGLDGTLPQRPMLTQLGLDKIEGLQIVSCSNLVPATTDHLTMYFQTSQHNQI